MGLSGADYNSYKTIIRAKRKVAKNYELISASNFTEGAEIENRKIGIFGEVEVKQRCQSQKRLSPEEKEQVVLGHKAGKTTYKLAEEFGCHRRTISSILEQHGIKPDKCRAQKKLNITEVIAMYEKEQQTLEHVAQCFGVSSHTISTCLRNNGVKIRSRWDYLEK